MKLTDIDLTDKSEVAAAHALQLIGLEAQDLAPGELHAAAHPRGLGKQAQHRHGARALAGAGLADDREALSGLDEVVQVLRGRHPVVVHGEVDGQAVHLEQRLRRVSEFCRVVHRSVLT